MSTTTELCTCGEVMDYEPPYPADASTNTREWLGGWTCPGCGEKRENKPPDLDAIGKYDKPHRSFAYGDNTHVGGWELEEGYPE